MPIVANVVKNSVTKASLPHFLYSLITDLAFDFCSEVQYFKNKLLFKEVANHQKLMYLPLSKGQK